MVLQATKLSGSYCSVLSFYLGSEQIAQTGCLCACTVIRMRESSSAENIYTCWEENFLASHPYGESCNSTDHSIYSQWFDNRSPTTIDGGNQGIFKLFVEPMEQHTTGVISRCSIRLIERCCCGNVLEHHGHMDAWEGRGVTLLDNNRQILQSSQPIIIIIRCTCRVHKRFTESATHRQGG